MNLLFVCTGNTCRSPFAAELTRRQGAGGTWEFGSAGLQARAGDRVPREASAAAAEWRLDLSHHRARPLTAELVEWADVLVPMTAEHADALRDHVGPEKICVLSRGDIDDPIGRGLDTYRRVYREIEEAVRSLLADRRLEGGAEQRLPTLGGVEAPPATRGERIVERHT